MPELEGWLKLRVMAAWGMTETVIHATRNDWFQTHPSGSMGRPTPGYEFAIVDPDSGEMVADGEIGELWIRGSAACSSFSSTMTTKRRWRKSFTEDGWFKTGDRVVMGEAGNFFYKDRDKDALKVGGENVSAREVEDCCRQVGGIADIAVVGRSHDMLDQVPVAFVIRGLGAPESDAEHAEQILAHCKANLATSRSRAPCTSGTSFRPRPSRRSRRTSCASSPTSCRWTEPSATRGAVRTDPRSRSVRLLRTDWPMRSRTQRAGHASGGDPATCVRRVHAVDTRNARTRGVRSPSARRFEILRLARHFVKRDALRKCLPTGKAAQCARAMLRPLARREHDASRRGRMSTFRPDWLPGASSVKPWEPKGTLLMLNLSTRSAAAAVAVATLLATTTANAAVFVNEVLGSTTSVRHRVHRALQRRPRRRRPDRLVDHALRQRLGRGLRRHRWRLAHVISGGSISAGGFFLLGGPEFTSIFGITARSGSARQCDREQLLHARAAGRLRERDRDDLRLRWRSRRPGEHRRERDHARSHRGVPTAPSCRPASSGRRTVARRPRSWSSRRVRRRRRPLV